MKINNLTLDEILHYGSLGEITISSPEDWYALEILIGRQTSEVDTSSYPDGEEVGYRKGWDECVEYYEIEE